MAASFSHAYVPPILLYAHITDMAPGSTPSPRTAASNGGSTARAARAVHHRGRGANRFSS